MPATGERDRTLFDDLGDCADEVAHTLESLGIHGIKNSVRILNPIVRYAAMRLPWALEMDVITGRTLHVVLLTGEMEVKLPDAVIAFHEAFNNGAYPALESPY